MAGALGRVPTENDLIKSFAAKGTDVKPSVASKLVRDVAEYRNAKAVGEKPKKKAPPSERNRATSGGVSSSRREPEPQPIVEQKPGPKLEGERSFSTPRPVPKQRANYGY